MTLLSVNKWFVLAPITKLVFFVCLACIDLYPIALFPLLLCYTLRMYVCRILGGYGVRFFFLPVCRRRRLSLVTSEVRKCEEHDQEHIFITENDQ